VHMTSSVALIRTLGLHETFSIAVALVCRHSQNECNTLSENCIEHGLPFVFHNLIQFLSKINKYT
jgi:hypothetical protein